ncbi:MAG: type IV secretion system DNA-binding domain-containing protein [Candidatus Zambryskibacteria bacterium]
MDEGEKITYFAETDARNKRVKFGIKAEDRLRHIYSIGKTGMGKSTMLENMAIQDIQNGEGMAFLDPHGKTADLLLDYVPEHRIKDVIYFAPFDTEFPISFNVMEDVGPDKRHLVVSGLMSAFEKIWVDAWSARMAYILQNTLAALLEYPGATMLGINRMLSDKTYRQKVVDNITDPTVKSFWVDEFAKYTDRYAQEATPAIQNKVGQFTSNPLIRNIIGQPNSSFDIRKIMDEKKIFIVNLSKGLVGENNANLLGSMIVTKIYLAAMSRADVSPQELKKLPNFYLYVDEFQSFANKSFADILSEARKYKLGLNITHQYIEQMAEEVRAAVFGNVGTMIAFRVGSFDAEVLEKEFAPVFTMEDIVNLGLYQIYLKLMIDQVASQPFSATTLPGIPKPEISFRDKALEMSRKTYTHLKAEVEKTITEWHQPEQKIVASSKQSATRIEKKEEMGKEIIEPKKETPKSGVLTKAIEEAMKEKPAIKIESKPDFAKATTGKKETMSLQELRHSHKDRNKGPTPEKMNALREALNKVQNSNIKNQNLNAEKKEETKKPEPIKEVPENVLRRILKGD